MSNETTSTRGRKAQEDAATEVEPVRTKRVVIQRPATNKDLGLYLGFNGTSAVYPFDTPIALPAEMVDYFRNQREAVVTPGEDGQPVVSYVNKFSIMDAPE